MSLGPVMLDLAGFSLQPEERELLCHPAVAGVILFKRNYDCPEQLIELTNTIRALRQPPLLIAVDQEGGRVQRFRDQFSQLPPAAWFGESYQTDAQHACQLAEQIGGLMAIELLAVGIDFSFAPVLDLGGSDSTVIGDRAFATEPEAVTTLAQSWLRGVHAVGMAAVGKHFPGHGHVIADSHLELPVDERIFEDLWQRDLIPFQRLIRSGIEAMMPAHVVYRRIDTKPAGFSAYWLQTVLRKQLDFQGIIFSDDLNMAAAGEAGDYPERAHSALAAGCDIVLICNNPTAAIQIVESLDHWQDPTANIRMVRLHGRHRPNFRYLHKDPRWQAAQQALTCYQTSVELSLGL